MMAASNDFEVSLRTVLSRMSETRSHSGKMTSTRFDVVRAQDLGPIGRQVLARFEEDFAAVDVDDVGEEDGLVHRREVDFGRGFVVLGQRIGHLLVELHAGEDGADRAAAADGVALLRFFLIEHAAVERQRDLIAGDLAL